MVITRTLTYCLTRHPFPHATREKQKNGPRWYHRLLIRETEGHKAQKPKEVPADRSSPVRTAPFSGPFSSLTHKSSNNLESSRERRANQINAQGGENRESKSPVPFPKKITKTRNSYCRHQTGKKKPDPCLDPTQLDHGYSIDNE